MAGLLAGVLLIIGIIMFLISPPVPGFEEDLATFPERSTSAAVTIGLFLVALLLLIVLLAGLYLSLKEQSRGFARIGLGSGVLAFVVTIFALQGQLLAANAFTGLYADALAADRSVVVATYGAVVTLLRVGNAAGFFFTALAFVAFGIAMRRSQDYGEGLAWLTVVLGIIILLAALVLLEPPAIIAVVVFALVLGWKVYSLSTGA